MMKRELKILLVEDELPIAMLMERQLEDIGYEIHSHVTSGQKALDNARENQPDVILMDIRLAGSIDGIEVAKRIISSNHKPPAIIFVTGYADEATRERAAQLNTQGFFVKPMNPEELKPILDRLIR